MAKLVAVRHSTQGKDVDPGLMSKAYFDKFGKDKGYVLVTDDDAVAAAEAASVVPAAGESSDQPTPSGSRRGRG